VGQTEQNLAKRVKQASEYLLSKEEEEIFWYMIVIYLSIVDFEFLLSKTTTIITVAETPPTKIRGAIKSFLVNVMFSRLKI
jgi:hypothetical protein